MPRVGKLRNKIYEHSNRGGRNRPFALTEKKETEGRRGSPEGRGGEQSKA